MSSADPPLAFVERLRTATAPGVGDAEWIVGRYLEARFAGRALADDDRREMRARAAGVRRALRRKRTPEEPDTRGGYES